MSLYIDTSCLLKLFFPEPESAAVASIVESERRVWISSLAVTEFNVRIQRLLKERAITARQGNALRSTLKTLWTQMPFEMAPLDGTLFDIADDQSRRTRAIYCKTLDRLHLAAAESLGAKRFLTNDDTQAKAAASIGLLPVRPRD